MVFVHKLSWQRYINYHTIYIVIIRVRFKHPSRGNITVIFVSKLSGLQCINYHVIYTTVILSYVFQRENFQSQSYQLCCVYIIMLFAQKLPGYDFQQLLSWGQRSYHGVRTWVINFVVCILSSYLHRIYQGLFFNIFSRVKWLPECLYVSYQLCCVYIIMLFTYKLPD